MHHHSPSRTTYHVTGALLSLPPSLSDLIDAVCVRWVSGRPVKYGKLISQFLEEITKYQKTRYTIELTLVKQIHDTYVRTIDTRHLSSIYLWTHYLAILL